MPCAPRSSCTRVREKQRSSRREWAGTARRRGATHDPDGRRAAFERTTAVGVDEAGIIERTVAGDARLVADRVDAVRGGATCHRVRPAVAAAHGARRARDASIAYAFARLIAHPAGAVRPVAPLSGVARLRAQTSAHVARPGVPRGSAHAGGAGRGFACCSAAFIDVPRGPAAARACLAATAAADL